MYDPVMHKYASGRHSRYGECLDSVSVAVLFDVEL